MAVRRMKPETEEERRVRDRVERCRRADPKFDRRGEYHAKCCELARNVGADPCDVLDEWIDRSAARLYLGGIDIEQAEELAWADVLERFTRQMAM